MATSNDQILKLALGTMYGDRIPTTAQASLSDIATKIMNYEPAKNAILTTIYNKIALTIISSMEFNNPFSRFRRTDINYGDTLEDIFVDIPEGYDYNSSDTNPFAQVKPDVKALYSVINKQLQYCQTIWDAEFRRALQSPYGLESLVTRIVSSLRTASEVDDYLIAKEILSQDKIYGQIVYMGATTGDNAVDGKTLLTAIKEAGSAMRFPSTNYNQQKVVNATPVERQVLIIRASLKNIIDLDVLAGLFNLDKADITQSIIEVDDFNSASDIAAVLIDERFLNFHYALEDGGLIYNPKALATNHFWNSWSINTASLFQNAVCFKFAAAPSDEG